MSGFLKHIFSSAGYATGVTWLFAAYNETAKNKMLGDSAKYVEPTTKAYSATALTSFVTAFIVPKNPMRWVIRGILTGVSLTALGEKGPFKWHKVGQVAKNEIGKDL